MAYGTKYIGQFKNFYNTTITVYIKKNGYSGATENITIKSCKISLKQVDRVFTRSCDIEIHNNAGIINYIDLLSNQDREYYIEVWNETYILFEGFLACDLNEINLLEINTIRLTFTDYLQRLKDIKLDSSIFSASYITLTQAIWECIKNIGYQKQLLILTGLKIIDTGIIDNRLFNAKISPYFVLKSNCDYKDAWTVLNAILDSTQSYFMIYSNYYLIIRYPDLLQQQYWYIANYLDSTVSDYTSFLYPATHNFDSGDFKYIGNSQTLQFEAGIKTLNIKLNEQTLYNLLPDPAMNNYVIYNDENSDWINTFFTQFLGQWVFTAFSDFSVIESIPVPVYDITVIPGVVKQGNIINGARFLTSWDPFGEYNNEAMLFSMQINGVMSSFTYYHDATQDNDLSISYKISLRKFTYLFRDGHQFVMIRVYYNGIDYRCIIKNSSGEFELSTQDNTDEWFDMSFTANDFNIINGSWVKELSINVGMGDLLNTLIDSRAVAVEFFTGIPYIDQPTKGYRPYSEDYVIGDFQISVDTELEENAYTYSTDKGFLKSDEKELSLFDNKILQLSNSIYYEINQLGIHVPLYGKLYDDNKDEYNTIVDFCAKEVFQDKARTRYILKANILTDKYLKILDIITDNSLQRDSQNINFVIVEYEYDLQECIYSVTAYEYLNEEITIS